MATASSTGRFAAPELLQLGRPPALAAEPYQTLLQRSLAKAAEEFAAAGINWDVRNLSANPGAILSRVAAYRDELRRQAIDDVVAESYLGSATGISLDYRAADYGVVRRVVQLADPVLNLPQILEDDESLRLRGRLAWEALSVAGPLGAYVFHALDAHPGVFDVNAIGPETGLVQPGEVLIVVQSRDDAGIPSPGILDAIAARLDAYEVIYASGDISVRTARDEQSVRPLGARVTVAAARPLLYSTTATIFVGSYSDAETIRLAAVTNLLAYQESRRRIGREVPRSGRIAALHLTGADGLPVVEEVEVQEDDLLPSHMQIPVGLPPTVNVVVR